MQQVLAEKAHSTSDHAYGAIPAPSELAARLASAGRAALSKATGEPAPATGSAGSSGATADAAYPVLHVPRFPEGKLRAGDEIEGLSQQQWFTLLSTPHADGPSIVGPFAIRVAGVVVKHEAFLIWTDGGKITGWMPASEIPPGGTRRGNWLLWSDGHLLQVIRDRPEDAKQMRAHAPQMSEHDLKNRQEADVELNRDLEHYVASGSSIEHAQHQVYKAHRDVLVQLVQNSFRIFGVFAGAMAAEEAIEAAGDAIGRLGKKTPSAESAEEGSTNGTRARSTEPNERALAGEETGTKRGSRVDESKAPRDMFEEGADAKEGQRIKPKHLHRELMQSEIGRETLEIIERQDIDVVLSYQAPEDPEGMIIYGRSYGNTATIYVTRCQSKQRVAQTAIHETTHAAGVRGSQRAEVIAEIRAAKHTGRVSAGDIRRIIERIKRDYPHLPYRILPPGEGSH